MPVPRSCSNHNAPPVFGVCPGFRLYVENDIEWSRASGFWHKEPETNAWIADFANAGEVFYDVGANIGTYSLFAAGLHLGLLVYGFEPHGPTAQRFKENVALNKRANVGVLRVALDSRARSAQFFWRGDMPGSNGGQLDRPVDETGREYESRSAPLVAVLRVDDVPAKMGIPAPTHVKIDVDGNEAEIVRGMGATLRNPGLRSVLVEINRDDQYIREAFREAGFTTDNKYDRWPGHSRGRRKGTPQEGAENVVFTRD